MRDAFGGAFSIKLMLIFLILYITFICVAMNYARAFRVKNRIINIIEEQEGYTTTTKTLIENYLAGTGYHITYAQTKDFNIFTGSGSGDSISSCSQSQFGNYGYCVVNSPSSSSSYNIYKVETYMVFTLPIVQAHFPIAIRGETRIIP